MEMFFFGKEECVFHNPWTQFRRNEIAIKRTTVVSHNDAWLFWHLKSAMFAVVEHIYRIHQKAY